MTQFPPTAEGLMIKDKIKQILAECSIGSIVPHSVMMSVSQLDREQTRQWFYMASKELNEEHGMVFRSVRGVGYERCENENIHTIGALARRAIRRKAERIGKVLRNAVSKSNELHRDPRVQREIVQAGLISAAAGRYGEKAVVDAPADQKPSMTAQQLYQNLKNSRH